ncbi:hypothetical protein Tco_0567534 [Tanacetum coccineum]
MICVRMVVRCYLPGRGSSVPIDLFTAFALTQPGERKSRGQVGWSRDQVYLEWWPRVLLGVQGGDGGGRVLARW